VFEADGERLPDGIRGVGVRLVQEEWLDVDQQDGEVRSIDPHGAASFPYQLIE
jgi:hypothetical protein